jgi:hypothetical protein
LTNGDLQGAWDLYLAISGGNTWVQKHGVKYAPESPNNDVEISLPLREFKKAYKQDRMMTFGSENVDDDYGYLCERVHPSGFCLQPYLELHGSEVRFVEALSSKDCPESLRHVLSNGLALWSASSG